MTRPSLTLGPELAARMERCTLCAACRTGCPTHDVTLLEGHGGRGRVILARGLAEGALEPDETVRAYLATCTRCGWCERVCPVDIPVVSLVEEALALFGPVAPRGQPEILDLEERSVSRLAREPAPCWPAFLALPVAVHGNCTDRWRGRSQIAFRALLQRAGAALIDVAQPHCCGASESSRVEDPQLAAAIAGPWLRALAQHGARTLVTNDQACLAHFRRLGWEEEGRRVLSAAEVFTLLGA